VFAETCAPTELAFNLRGLIRAEANASIGY